MGKKPNISSERALTATWHLCSFGLTGRVTRAVTRSTQQQFNHNVLQITHSHTSTQTTQQHWKEMSVNTTPVSTKLLSLHVNHVGARRIESRDSWPSSLSHRTGSGWMKQLMCSKFINHTIRNETARENHPKGINKQHNHSFHYREATQNHQIELFSEGSSLSFATQDNTWLKLLNPNSAKWEVQQETELYTTQTQHSLFLQRTAPIICVTTLHW